MNSSPPWGEDFLRRIEQLRLAVKRLGTIPREGERTAGRPGASLEVARHREYAQGDELRHIDWAAYARLEQFFIRQFAREEAVSLELLVDASPSMREGTPPKLESARRLVAAIGCMALHDRGQARVHWPTPSGVSGRAFVGAAAAPEFVRYLAGEPPAVHGFELPGALEEVGRRVGARPFLVVVSDLWMTDLERPLKRASARFGRTAVIHLLSPEELEPPMRGKVRLADSETAETKELYLDDETLAEYRSRVADHLRVVETACRQAEVGYVRISSDLPLEKAFFATVRDAGIVA
ncbi:MAG TPA: DUF58 domain-containing protein [Planctomycetota bacterium]|nr:DUF58 domain-containing protein [Planctomycetota bacterium]